MFFAAVWILDPIRDFPLQDDWAYFLSVKHLVDDASLRVLDYTSASLIFQSLWGAMFSMVLGLSQFDFAAINPFPGFSRYVPDGGIFSG